MYWSTKGKGNKGSVTRVREKARIMGKETNEQNTAIIDFRARLGAGPINRDYTTWSTTRCTT